MIRKVLKRLLQVLGLGILVLAGYLGFHYRYTAAFPRVLSAFYSKEYCSCYFVTEGTEEQCENFARQWLPIRSMVLDKGKRSVTVTGLFVTTTARYTGDRFGCVLDPWQ